MTTTLTRTALHVAHLPVTAERLARELSDTLKHQVRWEWADRHDHPEVVFTTMADPDDVRDAACLWLPDGGWWIG